MKIKRFSNLLFIILYLFLVISCASDIIRKEPTLSLVNSPFTRENKGVVIQLFNRDLCSKSKKDSPKPCPGRMIQPVSGATLEIGFAGFDWKASALTDDAGQAFISFENLPLAIIFSDQARLMVRTEVNGQKLQKELRLSKDRLTEIKVALELPPRLVTSLSFSDSNGNNLLDAEETGEIAFKIKNSGQGIANKVFVQMKPEKEYHNIVFDSAALNGIKVGDLMPGQEAALRFKISAGESIESGALSLLINVTEANGYDADPASVGLEARALPRPNLVIAQIGIDDSKVGNSNGIIDLGELIEVKAIVENKGDIRAERVLARISTGDPNITLRGGSEFRLGDLEPGSSIPLNFAFDIKKRYSGEKKLPIQIDFIPKRRLFEQLNQPLNLALGEVTPSTSSVVIGAKEPPPQLSYTVNLEDDNNNKVLEGGEKVRLRVLIENTGSGPAKGVGVILSGNKRLIEILGGNREAGNIPPSGKKEVILAGEIPEKIPEQEMDLIVGLTEQRGYGPSQARKFVVATRPKETTVETTVLSSVIDVDILPDAVNLPERKDDLAVVIGIGQYNTIGTQVKYAKHDAEIMRAYLSRLAGVPETRIKALYDKDATWGAINASLDDYLPRRVKENSRVYVYFSGHGAPDVKTQKAYLVPADGDLDSPSSLYPVEQLFLKLNALHAKEIVVMLDSCFAGEGPRSIIPSGARPMSLVVEDPLRASGRVISIAAAQVKQISSDFESMQHGLFTYYLLKGMRGEADTDRNGTVSLLELFSYVQPNVTDKAALINRDQTPVLNPSLAELGERANLPLARLTSNSQEPKERP